VLAALSGTLPSHAADPAWWTSGSSAFIDPAASHSTGENYAPANQGQLKNVAAKAALYLNSLPGAGAGPAIDSMIAGFAHTPDDYAPANLGQLKVVAAPFYARLLSLGYDTKQNLIDHGYPSDWAFDYPWDTTTPVATSENYAPANLGQLKLAFSFDLSWFDPNDVDSDGLPDDWEVQHGFDPRSSDGNHNGTNDADEDPDGDGLSNLAEQLFGTSPNLADTDGDGINDALDDFPVVSNPTQPGSFYGVPFNADQDEPDYTRFVLHWDASDFGPQKYVVERRIDSGDWNQLATLPASATTYTDENLLGGQNYQYRVTAVKYPSGIAGPQIKSIPSWTSDYAIPPLKSIEWKSSMALESKEGLGAFPEFTSPRSNPPRYYLLETFDFPDDHGWWFYCEHTVYPDVQQIVFDDHKGSTQEHSGFTMSAYSLSQSWDKGIFSRYESAFFSDYWWSEGGTPSSGTSSVDFLEGEAYTPDSLPALWAGNQYDPDSGHIDYFGHAVSTNPDGNHTLQSDGTWTGTGVLNTSADIGGFYVGEPAVVGPDFVLYDYGTVSLSNDYLTENFIEDVLGDMSDYPSVWTKVRENNWKQQSIEMPFVEEWVAWWSLSADEDVLGASAVKYRVTANPSVPRTLTWLEVFVPDPPPSPPASYSGNVTVLRARSLNVTDQETTSEEYTIDDALARKQNGQYYLLNPTISFEPVAGDDGVSYDNIEDNKYPDGWDRDGNAMSWKEMPGGGKRIFPDAQAPDDQQERNLVDVMVKTGVPHAKVWLKVFDVDDPTPEKFDVDQNTHEHIVDPNDQDGEHGEDNAGDTGGKFAQNDSVTIACVTDENGIAKVKEGGEWKLPRLKVGMQPGFNYRVAAAFEEEGFNGVSSGDKSASGYIPANSQQVAGFKGAISPMLTVWRRLNLEIDSMDAVTQPKGKYDHYTFTNAHWVSNNTLEGTGELVNGQQSEEDEFYKGGFIQNDAGKRKYAISHSTGNRNLVDFQFSNPLHTPVIPEGSTFEAYDDDDQFLEYLGLHPSLPRTDMHREIVQKITPVFSPIYLEIADADGQNSRKIVDFSLYSSAVDISSPFNYFLDFDSIGSKRDLHESTPKYWTWLLSIVYHGPRAQDGDPDYAYLSSLLGLTTSSRFSSDGSPKLSGICFETIRDLVFEQLTESSFHTPEQRSIQKNRLIDKFCAVVAHELGHNRTGHGHSEDGPDVVGSENTNGIMNSEPPPLGSKEAYFKPHAVKRLREMEY